MISGRFDIDDDKKAEIIIKGGILALIAIVVVADILITGGQFTLKVIEGIIS